MDNLTPFLANDYHLEQPYCYMFLEEFDTKSYSAHRYWQADRHRWSCCDEQGRLRFLNDGKQCVECHYDGDLLQSKKVYSKEELVYEEFYFYNSFEALEKSYCLVNGIKKNFKSYFYNSKKQLIRSQKGMHAVHYGYNDYLENTSCDFYENERLQERWQDTFDLGKLKQREEFYANKQYKRRHFFSYDEEERLQHYKLVSGQKLLLVELHFRYPVLITQKASQQRKKKSVWLEREIYRQFDHHYKGLYQRSWHLTRRSFTSLKNLSVRQKPMQNTKTADFLPCQFKIL